LALVFQLTSVRVLSLNVGSTSLKWSVLEMPREALLASGYQPLDSTTSNAERFELSAIVARAGEVDAVVHRVVHGGSRFSAPTYVDDGVVLALDALRSLDPTHMPQVLTGIAAARVAFPNCPHIACFDTNFHSSLPVAAFTYAVPRRWTEEWGVRRYGFHGLSVAFVIRRATELLGTLPKRLLVCHLGSGSSITAVREGHSLDTTMGFTSLEGVPMATRCGSIDPGLLLYVMREHGLTSRELDVALEQHSGLLGLFGNGDLREILRRVDLGDERAALSYGVWLTGLKRAFGAMLAMLEGADGIVFTGGIGENQPRIRAELLASFDWCGIYVDEHLNRDATEDSIISSRQSKAAVLRVVTREDLTMAREAMALLGQARTRA
jgi:acetate kinase